MTIPEFKAWPATRNYHSLGPVSICISRKGIASWGYECLRIGGLRLFTRNSNGSYCIASYHPRSSGTWYWSVSIGKYEGAKRWIARDPRRRNQWHDYYRLPFGRQVTVSMQDYHKHV